MVFYLDLTQRFWVFNKQNKQGSTAISLYFYLLEIYNNVNSLTFSISDVVISKELRLTRKTVKLTREKLAAQGLISFQSRNGIPCEYKMILNYSFKNNVEQIYVREIFKRKVFKFKYADEEITDHDAIISISSPIQKIPSLQEFLLYGASLHNYEENLEILIQKKYQNWEENGWKNSFGRPITNWKASIKNILPYLKNNSDNKFISSQKVPTISRLNIDSEII